MTIWKRSLSAFLAAVMLLGAVPMPAAAEEISAEETIQNDAELATTTFLEDLEVGGRYVVQGGTVKATSGTNWSYNYSTNTLTLKNGYTSQYGIYATGGGLNVIVNGEVSITEGQDCIYGYQGNLDIQVKEGATLNLTNEEGQGGIYCDEEVILHGGGTVNINSTGVDGIWANGGITVKGVTLNVFADTPLIGWGLTAGGEGRTVVNLTGGDSQVEYPRTVVGDSHVYAQGGFYFDNADELFVHENHYISREHLNFASNGNGTHYAACPSGCDLQEIFPETCSGGEATCTSGAVCDHCGGSYGEAGGHSYECRVTFPKNTVKGYTDYVCTACGDAYQTAWLDPTAYEGKSLAAIGDSITCGVGVTADQTDYVYLLAQQLGMEYIRLGASGTTLCTDGNRTCNIGMLTESNLAGADVVTILMGINDFCNAKDDYYTMGDITSTDTSTIYGAVRMWCEKIQQLRQKDSLADTQFYFLTPLITSWNNSVNSSRDWDQSKTNIHGYTLRDLCNAIVEVCALYDVPVIDLNLTSGLYYISAEDNNTTIFGGDGVHPGVTGHERMADALEDALLQNELRDNHAHGYGSWITTDYPSCKEGTEMRVCAECKATESRTLAATGHSYESVVTKPTCTEQGYTTYTCACGDSYVDDYVEATGHTYKNGICTSCGAVGGSCGTNVQWTFDAATQTLTISGSGAMKNYLEIGEQPWHDHSSSIQKVVVEEGVTSIGNYAFAWLLNLTKVELPDTLTRIGNYAFYNCWILEAMDIPAGVTKIGEWAFASTAIKKLVLPAGLTTIEKHLCYCCDDLEELVIPEGVESIANWAFDGCVKLAAVELPECLVSIDGDAFGGCTGLETITIPAGVMQIEMWAFSGCSNLKGIWVDADNANYSSDARGVLLNKDQTVLICAPGGLEGSYEIPDTVTSLSEYGFSSCGNLTDVVIPASVTNWTSTVFEYCVNLQTMTFLGDAMPFSEFEFREMEFTAYYPASNTTWTEDVLQDYGGTITWIADSPCLRDGHMWIDAPCSGLVCEICGAVEGGTGDHVYDDETDADCNNCGEIREVAHSHSVVYTAQGPAVVASCSGCGADLGSVTLQEEAPRVYDGNGKQVNFDLALQVDPGTIPIDYCCPGGCKDAGTHTASITVENATASLEFVIEKLPLCLRALDQAVYIGDPVDQWAFEMAEDTSVAGMDAVNYVEITGDTSKATTNGALIISGVQIVDSSIRDVTHNYILRYISGVLTVTCPGHSYDDETDADCNNCGALRDVVIPEETTTPTEPEETEPEETTAPTEPEETIPETTEPDDPTVGGSCGENVTWSFDTATGVLTISGSGPMENYGDCSYAPWYSYRDQLLALEIQEGVTTVGYFAFHDYPNLAKVTLAQSVIRLESNAFSCCTSLREIDLPDNLQQIHSWAFQGCTALESVTIPATVWENSCECFAGCSGLKTIRFEGDFVSGEQIFNGVTADAYYPRCNSTWTEEAKAIHGTGADLNWIPYGKDHTLVTDPGYPASCEKEGLSEGSHCSVCGQVVTAQEVLEPLGHTEEIIPGKEATCTEGSLSEGKKCTVCGVITVAQMPGSNNGHKEEIIPGKAATCTEPGLTDGKKCTVCGTITLEQEVISAKGHTELVIPGWAATCSESGLSDGKVCSVCGITIAKQVILKPTGHSYDDDMDPDCNSCGEIREVEVPTEPTEPEVTEPEETVPETTEPEATEPEETEPEETEPVKPAAPRITGSNVASSGKPRLTWAKVDGAVKYEIWRSTKKNSGFTRIWTQKSTTYTNTKAEAGKLYYYKVKAVDASGNVSDFSNRISRTCDLKQPVVKVSNDAATGKVKLTWAKVDGAKSYKVYRATARNGKYSLMKTVTGTSYINNSAKAGKTYYYKVIAVHSNSNANSAYSAIVSRMCDLARPVISVKRSDTGKPRISWKKVEGAVKYEVYRATSKNGTYKRIATTKNLYQVNKNAKAGVTYYYKVKAIHSNTNANSAFSLPKFCKAK